VARATRQDVAHPTGRVQLGRSVNHGIAPLGEIVVIASAHVYPFTPMAGALTAILSDPQIALSYGSSAKWHREILRTQVFARCTRHVQPAQTHPFCNNANPPSAGIVEAIPTREPERLEDLSWRTGR